MLRAEQKIMHSYSHLVGVLAAGLVWTTLASCSGGSSGPAGATTGGSGGSGNGSGGTTGIGGSLVIRSDAGNIISSDGSTPVGTTNLGDAACATESRTADRVPLDMYLMLDSSLSMSDFIADGVTTKWQPVQKALTAFVNDANSSGLGVGLQYFPLVQPGARLSCLSNDECKTRGPANPSHRVIVGLATDGFPTECAPTAIPSIAALATTAARGTPSIATFVIGVYSPAEQLGAQSNLDALALAGTSGKAFLVNTSQDVTTGFLASLNAIRTTALTSED